MNSKFSGHIKCNPYPLVLASPPVLCDKKSIDVSLEGRYVLVERGDCPFSSKAFLAQEQGAVGIIVANVGSEDLFSMGVEEEVGLSFPSVMVGEEVYRELRMHLESHLKGKVRTRMVVSRECMRGEKDWHLHKHHHDLDEKGVDFFMHEEMVSSSSGEFEVWEDGEEYEISWGENPFLHFLDLHHKIDYESIKSELYSLVFIDYY